MNAQVNIPPATEEVPVVKLDLGCGKNKKEGFFGLDQYAMPGVDAQVDLTQKPWLFSKPQLGNFPLVYEIPGKWKLPDNSVDEVHCSHFVEHLDFNRHNPERVRFFNELYRVMKHGAKALIVTPHWNSERAFGDFTHADKPVSEFFYYYLKRDWRPANAPHCDSEYNLDGFTCDFEASWGHGLRQDLWARNTEYQTYALTNFKAAATDLIVTVTKLPLKGP